MRASTHESKRTRELVSQTVQLIYLGKFADWLLDQVEDGSAMLDFKEFVKVWLPL